MRKAVFLDRDGVINNDDGLYYIYKPSDLKLNKNIAENICKINQQGYLVIVISNQGGIGKGLYSINDTDVINHLIEKEMEHNGAKIDAFYFCPHHPDSGKCFCRKPEPLMIEKAIALFDIDLENSFLIGDSPRDVEAAQKAGIKGILVPKNTDIASVLAEFGIK